MLVTFSCDAYENITLFGDVAKHLLTLMGHSGAVPGALLAQDVPEALAGLKKAIASQKSQPSSQALDKHDEPEVSLVHRALPLIALLESAVSAKCNVMWDYRK